MNLLFNHNHGADPCRTNGINELAVTVLKTGPYPKSLMSRKQQASFMSNNFSINNVATVWLPFNTNFNVLVNIYAVWTETVVLSDPNGVIVNNNATGTGVPMSPQQNLGTFTTPASFGNLPAYPVNVTITNSVNNVSYVNVLGWSVTSYDQMPNGGHNNLCVTFVPQS